MRSQTESELSAEFQTWKITNGFDEEVSAESLMHFCFEDLTAVQQEYLRGFLCRWSYASSIRVSSRPCHECGQATAIGDLEPYGSILACGSCRKKLEFVHSQAAQNRLFDQQLSLF